MGGELGGGLRFWGGWALSGGRGEGWSPEWGTGWTDVLYILLDIAPLGSAALKQRKKVGRIKEANEASEEARKNERRKKVERKEWEKRLGMRGKNGKKTLNEFDVGN